MKKKLTKIETYYNGKSKLETLEVEKQSKFKDGDIVQIDYDTFVILKRIEPYKIYYHYYYKNGITAFDGSISKAGCTMQLASKADQLTIMSRLKEYENKAWDAEKKAIVDLPKKCEFKAFDKVLVRNTCNHFWKADILSHINLDSNYPYECIGSRWKMCIPYNEQTAHLLGTTDDWEGGEK